MTIPFFPLRGQWESRAFDGEETTIEFTNLVGGLAGLTIHEREDGQVVLFAEPGGMVRHVVMWAMDGWVCSCEPFQETLSDCAATIVVRMANANVPVEVDL